MHLCLIQVAILVLLNQIHQLQKTKIKRNQLEKSRGQEIHHHPQANNLEVDKNGKTETLFPK